MALLKRAKGAGTFAGALALSVMIFFAGPMIAFGASRPLAPLWVRIVLIVVILGIACTMAALKYYRRRNFPAQWDPKLGIHVT